MTLQAEIDHARLSVRATSYDMSVGELVGMYNREEIFISPEYQRLFRWSESQKSRFVESLLLAIPTPPIFVFQRDDGVWELIDGLQRVSTILELFGVYPANDGGGEKRAPLVLQGTTMLPSLDGLTFERGPEVSKPAMARREQLEIRRAKLRIEILQRESDNRAKYDLFQRLNTGGSVLTEQEVRTCLVDAINRPMNLWIKNLAGADVFRRIASLSETQLKNQTDRELVVRFLCYGRDRDIGRSDIHAYLTKTVMGIAEDDAYDMNEQGDRFQTFCEWIEEAKPRTPFARRGGGFSVALYELFAIGIQGNWSEWAGKASRDRKRLLNSKLQGAGRTKEFGAISKSGVRGTDRVKRLFEFAPGYLKP